MRDNQRGAQVVEFAIVVSLLLLLVMGIIDFGRAYFSSLIITNAAREGARAAALGYDAATVYARVQSAAGGLPTAGPPLLGTCPAAGNQAWCIEAPTVPTPRGMPVSVRLEYNFRFLVPGFAGLPAGVFALTSESTMRAE